MRHSWVVVGKNALDVSAWKIPQENKQTMKGNQRP
jgi:hypothetical protein